MSYGLMVYATRARDIQNFFQSQSDRIYDLDHQSVVEFLAEFEGACDRWSSMPLNNAVFYPCNLDWLLMVDTAIASMGAPELQVSDLLFGELPANLPRPDETPMVGCWSADLVYQAYLKLKNRKYPGTDPLIRVAIEAVKDWLGEAALWGDEEAAAHRACIVGFYH
jgi:hypothetical protein